MGNRLNYLLEKPCRYPLYKCTCKGNQLHILKISGEHKAARTRSETGVCHYRLAE